MWPVLLRLLCGRRIRMRVSSEIFKSQIWRSQFYKQAKLRKYMQHSAVATVYWQHIEIVHQDMGCGLGYANKVLLGLCANSQSIVLLPVISLVSIITDVRSKTASVSDLSRGTINPVIHLIFARCILILVCQPLGKYNLQCTVLCKRSNWHHRYNFTIIHTL